MENFNFFTSFEILEEKHEYKLIKFVNIWKYEFLCSCNVSYEVLQSSYNVMRIESLVDLVKERL